jgi:NOL1/NOP2/sun family putative RNA methylase
MELKQKYPAKEEFKKRIENLLGVDDAERFFEISYTQTPESIRCNTIKISPDRLRKRLEKKAWKINQPFSKYPEAMIIDEKNGKELSPGELGKTKEHLLGYYYVQEISSMLPILALEPGEDDIFLDLCASPGSKTTQACAIMKNKGLIIGNDKSLDRIRILNSNLERCGVMNIIITKKDGVQLCERLLKKSSLRFDKILVDAPCSGEGTLRKSPKTFLIWNKKMIEKLSRIQKKLAGEALKVLNIGGEMVYSTCTLSPEENEEVVDYLYKNFDIEIVDIKNKIGEMLKIRQGINKWEGKIYNSEVKKCIRLYPQDNNTDGFFLAKIKKKSDKGCDRSLI